MWVWSLVVRPCAYPLAGLLSLYDLHEILALGASQHAHGKQWITALDIGVTARLLGHCLLQDAGPYFLVLAEVGECRAVVLSLRDTIIHCHRNHLVGAVVKKLDLVLPLQRYGFGVDYVLNCVWKLC